MPFEMRNLTTFPMERLYFDLKLEILEQMEPNDVIESVKVKTGFRSILLPKPWIVFGHHVHKIDYDDDKIRFKKFAGSSFVQLDADFHLPLIKETHLCDELRVDLRSEHFSDKHAAILKQFNSVKHSELLVNRNEHLLKFLENFRSVIEESAYISVTIDLFKENQVICELFKNFIVNQMNVCEEVEFYCHSAAGFPFYNEVFTKNSIKFLSTSWHRDNFEEIVQSIVEKWIPSKNLNRTFLVETDYSQQINARIVDFLSQFPGMKRFDGENQQEVTKKANELLKKQVGDSFHWTNSLFFRRNIDSSRDCVYIFSSHRRTLFCAFYVQPQSEIMMF